MDDLIQHGRVRRAVLGISIAEVNPADARAAGLTEIRGVMVDGFDPPSGDSPAARAGMQPGDIIISAAGQRVNRISELQRIIRGFKPGDVVDIEAMRFREQKSFRVRLAEPPRTTDEQVASADRPDAEPARSDARNNERLGISVSPVPQELITARRVGPEYRAGLLVTDVSARGPAYRELLPNRDIIVRTLNPVRKDIRSISDLEQVVTSLKRGDVLSLLVWDTAVAGDQYGRTRVVNIPIQ
jgi:serine protease Do